MAVRTSWGLSLYGATDGTADTWAGVPFVLEETSGRKRRLELQGEAKPVIPLRLEANRRARVTYYPGQTGATDQVLGYDDGTTAIRGRWDSWRLRAADLATITDATSPAPQRVESVEDLRELVRSIVLAGQRIRVEWAGVERFAASVRFAIEHEDRGRADWELEFEWSGAGKFVALPVVDEADAGTRGLLDTMGDLLDLAAYPANLALDVIDFADVTIRRMEGLIGEVGDVLRLYTQGATDLLALGSRAVGLLDTVKREARAVRDAVLHVPAAAGVGSGVEALPDSSVALRELQRWLAETKRTSTAVAAQASRQAFVFAELSRPAIKGVVTVVGDTDLRHVALQQYGSPEAWTAIADANGLVGSQVSAGTALVIPARPTAA